MYCDFCSSAQSEETVAAYCSALIHEIERAGDMYAGCEVITVYLGGGTPSIVPAREMARVLDALHRAFAIRADAEFTSEANPGTLTAEWLDAVTARGVNRLSLGMQAAQDELLRSLGRIHTHAQTVESVRMARACGVRNLSLDLMYALPGQSANDFRESLEAACALAPEHISAYSLILEDGTLLKARVDAGELAAPDDDAAADMCALAEQALAARGFHQYEISNYAREGRECRHNIGYWQGTWYLGLGLSAHGMLPAGESEAARGARYVRQANGSDLHAYIAGDGNAVASRELVGADEAMFETMMLGLRMNAGVAEADFLARHGIALAARYGGACRSLVTDGLALWDGGRFRLTPRGMLLQNAVLMRFMD